MRTVCAALVACATLVSSAATATTFSMDSFTIHRGGSLLFQDIFDDGIAPGPNSGPDYLVGTADPTASYSVIGAITESSGRAFLDAASSGQVIPNVLEGNSLVTRAQLLTPQEASARTLGANATFSVSGVFDLVIPGHASEDYRIRLTDRSTQMDNSQDSVDLRVQRAGDNQVYVTFLRANYNENEFQEVQRVLLDLTGGPDQIQLTLSKASATSHAISASYAYLKDGSVISTANFAETINIFNDENFTRSVFNAQVLEGVVAPRIVAQLQTGSPTSIGQNVSTASGPFNLSFDYQFETTFGELTVTIDGEVIGTFSAPGTLSGVMQTANLLVDNPNLFNLTDALLQFTLDGPTGAIILLDNVVGLTIINDSFQTGNLTGWLVTTSGAGAVGVAQLAPIPVPAALPLFASALGAAGLFSWWRRRRAAAA